MTRVRGSGKWLGLGLGQWLGLGSGQWLGLGLVSRARHFTSRYNCNRVWSVLPGFWCTKCLLNGQFSHMVCR